MRSFLHALEFFTRIALPEVLLRWRGFSHQALATSVAHLPGVGWVVGALTAVLWWGLLEYLPTVSASLWVAAVLSTAWGLRLTGALHEDGLADLADGLGATRDRERALVIMKDSHMGVFGGVALVLGLLAKCSLLVALGQVDAHRAAWLLWLGHVLSRGVPVWLAHALPHVGDVARSKSHAVSADVGRRSVVVTGVWCVLALLVPAAAGIDLPWGWGCLGLVCSAAFMQRLLWRRLQGFTGDGLGAAQQVSELAFYLACLLGWGRLG